MTDKFAATERCIEWVRSDLIEGQHSAPFVNEARAELAAARDRISALEAALLALCDKLDLITHDPKYESVWTLAYLHGQKYTGPNWATELAAAREALKP